MDAKAQTCAITGVVKDQKTGETLIGATIKIVKNEIISS